MGSAYVRGEAQAGRTDNGTSAFAKATHGRQWSGVASTSKSKLSVTTLGEGSRSMASTLGAAAASVNSAALTHTDRRSSYSSSSPRKLRNKHSTSTALTRIAPSSTSLITQQVNLFKSMVSSNTPRNLDNALVASRGDASAVINSGGEAEAEVSGSTGYARIFKTKDDFVIESHGTGQAGRMGYTMWALDGDNMAMAHLPSLESGGIFCPCSMRQDARTCDCVCHGGRSVYHDDFVEQHQRAPPVSSGRRRVRHDYPRQNYNREMENEYSSNYSDGDRRRSGTRSNSRRRGYD
jgi:hypothetical protein